MIAKVKLPKADANMDEGTVGKWLVSEGSTVSKGDPIVEIITDKTVFEFESPKSGTLRKIVAPERSVVPPGYVLALIGDADEKLPDVQEYNRSLLESHLKEKALTGGKEGAEKAAMPPPSAGAEKGKVRATPSARRLAAEHKIDLSEVKAIFQVEVVNEKLVQQFLEKRK